MRGEERAGRDLLCEHKIQNIYCCFRTFYWEKATYFSIMWQDTTVWSHFGKQKHWKLVLRWRTCKPSYLDYDSFITAIIRLHLFRTLNPPPKISNRFQIPARRKLRESLLLSHRTSQFKVQAEKYYQYTRSPKIVSFPYPKVWIFRG